MGKSYFVPRSAKGESRILYIFTIKSFAFTVSIGLIGALAWYIMSSIFDGFPLVAGLVITGIFGGIRIYYWRFKNTWLKIYGTI